MHQSGVRTCIEHLEQAVVHPAQGVIAAEALDQLAGLDVGGILGLGVTRVKARDHRVAVVHQHELVKRSAAALRDALGLGVEGRVTEVLGQQGVVPLAEMAVGRSKGELPRQGGGCRRIVLPAAERAPGDVQLGDQG